MLTVEDGSNLYPHANVLCVLADNADGDNPLTRWFKATLIDFTVDVGDVITLVGVTEVRRLERESLDDLGLVFENPDDTIAVATGIYASQSVRVDGVGEYYIPFGHLDTQMAIHTTGNVRFLNVDDCSDDDVLLLNVAKFLLDVVRNSSKMAIFLHFLIF